MLSLVTRIKHLKKLMLFKSISDTRRLEICRNMQKKKYQCDEVIITEDSPGKNFYFLYKGKVRVMKNNKYVRELEEGNVFGETSLILNENHSATIVATSQMVVVYILSKQDFFSVFDNKMQEFVINKISLQDNFKTNLDDLYFIKSLGQGKFGTVSLVHNTKNLYAIKAIPKDIAHKKSLLIKYFQTERRILLSLEHPFIITLVKTLKSPNHIFYLTEYVNGIVMSKYIEDFKTEKNIRNNYEIQFFIGILLITLDYLNKKGIAHRDIKPDNLMINHNVKAVLIPGLH